MNKIYVVGIGPGEYEQMTIRAAKTLESCDTIIGYGVYVDLIKDNFPGKEFLTTPMTKEAQRCTLAFEEAAKGKTVSVICSGDAGIYAMAGLMYEIGRKYPEAELEIICGVTAAISGAAALGAPLANDFCVISLSDLLTPRQQIETRLKAAVYGDFAVCLYNPQSRRRKDYLAWAADVMLSEGKSPETVCGIARNIGREGESIRVMSLADLRETPADMFTTVFIGSSKTEEINGKMVAPRGYKNI